MDIPLTSDYKTEDIKNFLTELAKQYDKKEIELRKTLTKKYEEKAINRLEKEIQNVLGDKGIFERDYVNDFFHLELSENCPPTTEEEMEYEIKINLITRQVYFNIDPENIKLSIDDFLDIKEEGEEREFDETSEIQSELDKYKEEIQNELEKNKDLLSELEEFLKDHKKKVLSIDYVLRRFAKERGFEYITNHSFPIPEDKNQLKLENAVSQ